MAFPVPQTGKLIIGQPMREMRVNLGSAYSRAKYQFFLTGTSTPANVYQDGALTTPFTSLGTGVVQADTTGLFPAIYLDSSVTYKVTLLNSGGNPVRTYDPYAAPLAATGSPSTQTTGLKVNTQSEYSLSAAAGGTGYTLTINAAPPAGCPIRLSAPLPGSVCLEIDTSATTGAQTATFTSTNKPGYVASGVTGWLPIKCDGVVYYTPLWRGDAFVPIATPPQVLGQTITASNFTWNGDGTTTVVGGLATPTSWYLPTTAGIGASFWVNITKTSGKSGVNFSAAQGAWTNITAGGLAIALSGATNSSLGGTYQISSNSSGTIVVASGNILLSGGAAGPNDAGISYVGGAAAIFAGNGTVTLNGTGTTNWYLPTTANVGASYWINITRTGGTGGCNFTAAQGVWTNITNGGLTVDISGVVVGTFSVQGSWQISSNSSGTAVCSSGSISLSKTISSLIRVYTATGAGSETMPANATNITIEAWGPGGGGSGNKGTGCQTQPGQNGGTGAYVRTVTTIAALGGSGKTINHNIGTGGAGGLSHGSGSNGAPDTTVSNGTSTGLTTMDAGAGIGGTVSVPGAGGAASGGNSANTTGTTGSTTGITGSVGGDGSPYGGGGQGWPNPTTGSGSAGQNGAVVYYYT